LLSVTQTKCSTSNRKCIYVGDSFGHDPRRIK
jgi:hypothetical protein